jgi:drug/metabolite transporter (DMT)-like permease
MLKNLSPHLRAVFQALFVTLLWSTSWVLIKIGLQDIPALPFAGLRYTLAFMCLLPFAIRSRQLTRLRGLSSGTWARLILLGLLFYSVTQGAQFLSLFYLPALTTSLLLSFTTIIVALLGILLLGERPTMVQWGGTGLYLIGVSVYFYPVSLPSGEVIGLIVAGVGVLANALSSILGRHVNRGGQLEPMTVTVVSMGGGAVLLLAGGVLVQGLPHLTPMNWAIILWLAVVNSALAYTLWNHTLRTLSAMESSIINNTMLFQIALLAWAFLGERLSGSDHSSVHEVKRRPPIGRLSATLQDKDGILCYNGAVTLQSHSNKVGMPQEIKTIRIKSKRRMKWTSKFW